MHTSTTTNKSYIGVTCRTVQERFNEHARKLHLNLHFGNAIRKYGKGDFKTVILLETNDKNVAYEQEIQFIEYYDTYDSGYNLSTGGESPPYEKSIPYHTGINNHQFKGFYHTPTGIFVTLKEASKATGKSWQIIRKRCNIHSNRVLTKNAILQSNDLSMTDIGKTYKDIGYFMSAKTQGGNLNANGS